MRSNSKRQSFSGVKIAVSVLDVDFRRLEEALKRIEKGKPDFFHLDIMDGHFVPNISFGPALVKTIRRITDLPLESHLMVSEPLKFIKPFAQAGSDLITVHCEAKQFQQALKEIKSYGLKAGIALNPETSLERIKNFLDKVDLVLVMSVHPGFGGQKLIKRTLPKLKNLRKIISPKWKCKIEIDGGINLDNAEGIISAGADILVVGAYISRTKNPAQTLTHLRKKLQSAGVGRIKIRG